MRKNNNNNNKLSIQIQYKVQHITRNGDNNDEISENERVSEREKGEAKQKSKVGHERHEKWPRSIQEQRQSGKPKAY